MDSQQKPQEELEEVDESLEPVDEEEDEEPSIVTNEPQGFAYWLTASGCWRRDVQLRHVDTPDRPQNCRERQPVDDEQPARIQPAKQQRRQRRAEDARTGHHGGVQRHHVGDVAGLDEFDHEPTAGRVVDRLDNAVTERHEIDHRQ